MSLPVRTGRRVHRNTIAQRVPRPNRDLGAEAASFHRNGLSRSALKQPDCVQQRLPERFAVRQFRREHLLDRQHRFDELFRIGRDVRRQACGHRIADVVARAVIGVAAQEHEPCRDGQRKPLID